MYIRVYVYFLLTHASKLYLNSLICKMREVGLQQYIKAKRLFELETHL